MTLGQKLLFSEDEYPLTLYFDDFYYYENKDGKHLLMHVPTRKSTENFKISNKVNIMKQINLIFGLAIEEMRIYDPTGEHMLFHGTKDSSSTITDRGDGSGVTKFAMEMTFLFKWLEEANEKGNVNGRVYTKPALKKAFSKWIHDCQNGLPTGEIDHVARDNIPL